jgi:hypothetical protein
MRLDLAKELKDRNFEFNIAGYLSNDDFVMFREIVTKHVFVVFTPVRESLMSARINEYKLSNWA